MSGEPYQMYPDWQHVYARQFPPRTAWQCPGCKTWHAPHADKCECQKPLPPPPEVK